MKSTAKTKSTVTMLEYFKLLLNKISFSDELLQKEYQKGLKYLDPKDQEELKQWLKVNGKVIE